METYNIYCNRRVWIFVLSMLIVLDTYFHVYVYYNILQTPERRRWYSVNEIRKLKNVTEYYKYPLFNGSNASMDYTIGYNSSYYWFTSMKHLFKNISANAWPRYPRKMPMCKLNTTLEPIFVNKTELELEWIEEHNNDVSLGGYYAPANCRAVNRVAIIIPYRDRPASLHTLLNYLHSLLKKQLLEYRIFVIEQYGSEKFNKGTLYNIAFLEIQRFDTWNCLIFHDVDLVPEDERILYSCSEHPTHMASVNDSWVKSDLRRSTFGGVIAITPEQYEVVNGYSNLFWDWGVEDDDFYGRTLLLTGSRMRFRRDDLTSTKYNLVNVTQTKLYTHILADVNPTNMPLDPKSLMQRLFYVNERTFYGHEEFKSR